MKILVLADTHIPDRADNLPPVIIEQAKQADLIFHLGDFTSVRILNELKKFAEVKAVFGNMDTDEIRKILPQNEIINIGKFKIGLIHGSGPPDKLVEYVKGIFDKKVDCIIFGHAHSPYNECEDGILILNPGSVSDKIFAPYNSYGILEIDDRLSFRIERI